MVNQDVLLDLYRHMEWADAAVWTAVLAAGDGPSDPKIRGYLYIGLTADEQNYRSTPGPF